MDIAITNASGQTVTIPSGFFYYSRPFDGWRVDHFYDAPGGPTSAATDYLADPDSDGSKNVIEYFLGTDPRQPTTPAINPTIELDGGVPYLTLRSRARAPRPMCSLLSRSPGRPTLRPLAKAGLWSGKTHRRC